MYLHRKRAFVAFSTAVALVLLSAGRSEAGSITFGADLPQYGPVVSGGGSASMTYTMTDTATGFAINNFVLSYTSVGTSPVTISYDFTRAISFTAGSYQTAFIDSQPTIIVAPAGRTVNFNGGVQFGGSYPPQFGLSSIATNTYTGPAGSFNGYPMTTSKSSVFSTLASTSYSSSVDVLLLGGQFTFTPTAVGQTYSITLGETDAAAYSVPEPGTLTLAGIGGLFGMCNFFRRRKAVVAA